MTNFVTTLNFISDILNPILKMPFTAYTNNCVSFKLDIRHLLSEELYERITVWYANAENLTDEERHSISWIFDCYAYLEIVTDLGEPTYRNHLKVVCECLHHKDVELAHIATDSTEGCELISKLLEQIETRLEDKEAV